MADSTTAPASGGKLTLHHLNHSQSQRILWLLCELFPNEPTPPTSYDLIVHSRQAKGKEQHRSPSALKQVHPMGKAPTLITPSGRVIIESSAIASYLIATYDTAHKLQGDGDAARQHDAIRDETFASFANASIMPVAGIRMFLDVLTAQTPFVMRPLPALLRYGANSLFVRPEMDKMWAYLDAELDGRDFFLGSKLSRADFMMSWPADFCVQRGYLDLEQRDEKGQLRFARVKAWRERVLSSDGWKEALAKGGGSENFNLTTY